MCKYFMEWYAKNTISIGVGACDAPSYLPNVASAIIPIWRYFTCSCWTKACHDKEKETSDAPDHVFRSHVPEYLGCCMQQSTRGLTCRSSSAAQCKVSACRRQPQLPGCAWTVMATSVPLFGRVDHRLVHISVSALGFGLLLLRALRSKWSCHK